MRVRCWLSYMEHGLNAKRLQIERDVVEQVVLHLFTQENRFKTKCHSAYRGEEIVFLLPKPVDATWSDVRLSAKACLSLGAIATE